VLNNKEYWVAQATTDNIQEFVDIIKDKLSKPLVIFDLETTDVDVNTTEIVQFAGIRVNLDGGVQELEFICKPSVPISNGASEVHGITNDDVDHMLPFKSHASDIKKLFQEADVAGFNLKRFDVKILNREMEKAGHKDFLKDKLVYDAYLVFVNHCSRKLSDAVQFYTNEEMVDAHDALGDVKATLKVMAKQVEREGTTVKEVTEKLCADKKVENELSKYIVDIGGKQVLNFSKNKGTPIDKVDKGFLKWVIANDFPKVLKDVCKKYIK
jgi:DNA polymerase-3 subunit epsilon